MPPVGPAAPEPDLPDEDFFLDGAEHDQDQPDRGKLREDPERDPDATDTHHSQRSSKPGSREMTTPGMATSAMRTTDAMSEGMVLPIAWNVLEATNTRPDAT